MIGRVYKITNADESIVYIGSTINTLKQRWDNHKSSYREWVKGDVRCHAMIYHHFKEIGIEQFRIYLISKHEIKNKTQLNEFEQLAMDTTDCVNKNAAFRSKDYKKQYRKEYYESNLERIKKYREDNKDHIKQLRSQKMTCDCGGKYTRWHKSTHEKTKKHQKWLKST